MTSDPVESSVTLSQLEEAIQQASSQYYRLVILAGLPGSGKTAVLQSIGHRLGCQVVNVNLELSKRMLELTRTQRSRQVERLLKELIAAAPGEVVLLDNLEILFDTSLESEYDGIVERGCRHHALWLPRIEAWAAERNQKPRSVTPPQ